jgi:hypothetical protein
MGLKRSKQRMPSGPKFSEARQLERRQHKARKTERREQAKQPVRSLGAQGR